MANQTNYKAQFCRQYFTQLKSYIREFDFKNNNLGMNFLSEVIKQDFSWDNTVSMIDKNLMLAIEEYFHITDANEELQDQRETLFSALINPDKEATDNNIRICFVDEITLRSILCHFGVKEEQKTNTPQIDTISNQIKSFNTFAETVAYGGELSFANFNNALELFRQLRNNNAHYIIKQEGPQRKIAFQFLSFTYIGLVYLLRMAWYQKSERLTNYKKPEVFSIPKQSLHIIVNRQDSTNDNIIGYEFVPNIKNGSERITKLIDPTPRLEITVPVRKYDKFKLIVKYGTPDKTVVDIAFGNQGEKMLTYYYWNPTLKINLPSSSSILPGLDIGANSTEELIAKLLDNVNKQQEGKAKDTVSGIVDNILNALEPTLQRIKELSAESRKEVDNEDKRNILIQKIDTALQKQIDKNEENFQKVLKGMDELNKNQTKKFGKLESKAAEYFKDLRDEIIRLSEQIDKEKENTLLKDKTVFWWKKHLPHYMLILGAIVLFIISLFNDFSLSWLQNTFLWLFLPIILLTVVGCLWTPYVYRTTVSNRSSIIKSQTKWISIGILAVAFVFTALAIAVIPNKTVQSLATNYDFSANHKEGDNAKAVRIMEDYLKNETSDDENIRIQLTNFYLNYSNDRQKAIEITTPMRDDIIKYKKGSLYAAEALFSEGKDKRRDRQAYEIIKKFKNIYANTPAVINRIEGFMYCYNDQYLDKNLMYGIELLKRAAEQGDSKAQYYLGHIYSHIMSDWTWDPQNTYFNLIDAINYYRKAVAREPKAAIELGSLYADLNMNDSAKHYFQKAITVSEESLKLEAIYRMGILLEKLGEKYNRYIKKAIDKDYAPALIYDAINNCDHQQAIERYESMGKYKGYRYIPPVVFEYILNDDKAKALDTLISVRKNGQFNDEFIDGMALLLKKENVNDSVRGLELMRKSAIKGCKYAKLIWFFRKMESEIKINDYSLNEIDILDELGKKDIPFANILTAELLAKKASYLDSIDTKQAELLYQAAADKAIKAIELGHPAGVIPFYDSKLINFFFSHRAQRNETSTSDLAMVYLILRMAPTNIKKWCLHSGWALDYTFNREYFEYINANGKKNLRHALPKDHNYFWYDVTLANNYILFLTNLLYYDFNDNVDYTTRMFCKVFDNVVYPDDMTKKILSFKIRTMDTRFYSFIDSLIYIYQNDPLKVDILNGVYTLKNGENITFEYTDSFTIHYIDNITILNEYSDINSHIYDMPL